MRVASDHKATPLPGLSCSFASAPNSATAATGARSRLSGATGGGAGLAVDDGGARSQLVPQGRQNGFPGVTGLPHDGHRPNGAPQCSLNLANDAHDNA